MTAKAIIAVVDDEPDIVELVSHHLKKEHYDVKKFFDGEDLLKYIDTELPHLIVLDLMLPKIDGLEICRILKSDQRTHNIPIIMLTAKTTETDRVVGLELGADDYIVKPFSPRELVARVKAVLRRSSSETDVTSRGVITIHDLQLNPHTFRATIRGEDIHLTPTEFNLLKILAERPGWVFSRNKLLDLLWGEEKVVLDRTIDVHIMGLRKKMGDYGKLIKVIRGIGYKLEK
jgi:DNA-binding response OmpR family regulator